MPRQHCGIKMEQESDHSNSDDSGAAAVTSEVGTDVSQLEERVRALVAEKGQLDADLAQAKSTVEDSESEVAGSRQKIKELNDEKNKAPVFWKVHVWVNMVFGITDVPAGMELESSVALSTAASARSGPISKTKQNSTTSKCLRSL